MSGGKFSFGRLFLGFGCGIMIPHVANHGTYYAISSCFLAPHLKFWRENKERHHDKAIPIESLDAYFIDIGKSLLFFLIIIGPTLYSTYYLKRDLLSMYGLGESENDSNALSNFASSVT